MGKPVLILGNPLLRSISNEVMEFESIEIKKDMEDLSASLEEFRGKNGFGRGIAAIQIGIKKRMIALNLGKGPFVIFNPKITQRSEEKFLLWDDCMSFPDLLARVSRNESISIEYQDENGMNNRWENIDQALSELLQHEIDHLDGILATDRVNEPKDIIYKSEYVKNKRYYDSIVDYLIQPTI